jgi:beta-phosphoglucomutase-like phosphatase (HAD superfamily)
LAVASTSHENSVRAVLEHAVGKDLASSFTIFAGDIVPRKKPAPDIYLLAIEKLNLISQEVIVVEDSSNGLRAAIAAGLKTIVTISSYTAEEDFTGASLVVSSLGDKLVEKSVIVKNPLNLVIEDEVKISDLNQILKIPAVV